MEQRSHMHVCILAFLAMATRVILAAPSQQAGVCIGTLGDHLPSQVMSTMEACGIAKFRIYEPQPEILQQSTRLVSLTINNDEVLALAASADEAVNWVEENFIPYKNIYEIVVGNEAIPGKYARYVVSAMYNIQSAIIQTDRPDTIVTTSISSEALAVTFPPSQATFAPDAMEAMTEIVQLFRNYSSWTKKLYVNVYPYFAYKSNPYGISLDFALFQSSGPAVRDNNLEYTNLFDEIFDAFVWALEKIGGGDIGLTVGETGWPYPGKNGDFTGLASTYNTNLYNHLVNNNGSPKRPKDGFDDFFIFSMFNDLQKPDVANENWGFFDANFKQLYATPLC